MLGMREGAFSIVPTCFTFHTNHVNKFVQLPESQNGGEYPIGFKGVKTTTEAYGEVEWGDLVQTEERAKASWRVGRIEHYVTAMANDTAVHLQLCFC